MSDCGGKERFLTFALASRIADKRRRQGVKRQPYSCRDCHGYHIGSTLGSNTRVRGDAYVTVRNDDEAYA